MGDTKKPKPIIATSSSSRSPVLYYALFSAPLGLLVGFQNLLPGRTLSLMSSGSGSLSPGWLFAGILGWYTSLLVRFPFQMALQNYYAKASISSVCSVSSVSSVSTVSSVSPVSTVSTVSSSALDPLLIKKTDGDDGGHLHGPGCSHNHHHNQQQPLSLQDLQNVQLPPWAYSLLNAVTAFSETFVRQVLLMYLLGNSSLSTTTTTTPPHVLLLTSSMAWSRAFSLSLGWMLIETVAFCARFSMMSTIAFRRDAQAQAAKLRWAQMEGKSFFEFTPHWDILSRFTSMLFHASYSLLVAIMIVASQTTTTTTTTAASASPPGISPEFLAARMGSVLMISGLMRSALVMASSLLYKRIGIGATETVLLGVASAVFAWVLKLWQ